MPSKQLAVPFILRFKLHSTNCNDIDFVSKPILIIITIYLTYFSMRYCISLFTSKLLRFFVCLMFIILLGAITVTHVFNFHEFVNSYLPIIFSLFPLLFPLLPLSLSLSSYYCSAAWCRAKISYMYILEILRGIYHIIAFPRIKDNTLLGFASYQW